MLVRMSRCQRQGCLKYLSHSQQQHTHPIFHCLLLLFYLLLFLVQIPSKKQCKNTVIQRV